MTDKKTGKARDEGLWALGTRMMVLASHEAGNACVACAEDFAS